MLYREIIAVCSQIHTKHINTLCGQNVELFNVKLVVYMVTAVLRKINANINVISLDWWLFRGCMNCRVHIAPCQLQVEHGITSN